jgi:hypothetical protein
LWKPDVRSFVKKASQQLSFKDLEPGEVLNRITPVDEAECTVDAPPMTNDQLLALTPDQLEAGIHAALKAHDVEAVYGYLMLLALKDPNRAEEIRQTLKAALAVARTADVDSES